MHQDTILAHEVMNNQFKNCILYVTRSEQKKGCERVKRRRAIRVEGENNSDP